MLNFFRTLYGLDPSRYCPSRAWKRLLIPASNEWRFLINQGRFGGGGVRGSTGAVRPMINHWDCQRFVGGKRCGNEWRRPSEAMGWLCLRGRWTVKLFVWGWFCMYIGMVLFFLFVFYFLLFLYAKGCLNFFFYIKFFRDIYVW